jgi:hypothetical protein
MTYAICNGSAGYDITLLHVLELARLFAGEGRTGLGHLYQLHQSTVSAGV